MKHIDQQRGRDQVHQGARRTATGPLRPEMRLSQQSWRQNWRITQHTAVSHGGPSI